MQSVVRGRLDAVHGVMGRGGAAILAACVVASPVAVFAADPVIEWNETAVRVTLAAVVNGRALSPVEQTRVMAIVHVAMHDAVNAVTGRYEQYRRTERGPDGASPEAAAIAAAYRAVLGLVGDAHFGEATFLTSAYVASLDHHGIAPDDPGLSLGFATAEGILALRQDDGSALAGFPYLPPNAGAPGVWEPLSAAASSQALLPGWGGVTPWVLRSGSQFRPDAPPALDSERYARDYEEVKARGARFGHNRTDEQTSIALFWRASPIAIWSPILRTVLESHDLDLSSSARIAALVNLAASDASVAVWDGKYFYNSWRPQPAIVNGDEDGNPATEGQADWLPHLPTPPHPEYPSAHAANSAAIAFVLTAFFGDAPGFVIEATSATATGFVRRWSTFSEGVGEVIDARVYSGIHFRTADEVGARQGRHVAQFVLTHALRSARKR